jgi:hypothetical protein
MPHPIDRLLFDGQPVPPDVLSRELAKPLPKVGDSHWGDAMRELFEVVAPADLGTQAIVLARSIIEDEQARMAASRIEAALSP